MQFVELPHNCSLVNLLVFLVLYDDLRLCLPSYELCVSTYVGGGPISMVEGRCQPRGDLPYRRHRRHGMKGASIGPFWRRNVYGGSCARLAGWAWEGRSMPTSCLRQGRNAVGPHHRGWAVKSELRLTVGELSSRHGDRRG